MSASLFSQHTEISVIVHSRKHFFYLWPIKCVHEKHRENLDFVFFQLLYTVKEVRIDVCVWSG